MKKLKDKVAVITGGTRGFGLEIARSFLEEGASVVITSRSHDSVNGALSSLEIPGGKVIGLVCDVGDLTQVQALAEYAWKEFDHFDAWVNNAGQSAPYGPTVHVSPERFVEATRTNILGTYYGSLIAMRHFIPRGKGKLINILGYGDRNPGPLQNAYASSKAWIRNFTLALAKEYKESGVGIFGFNPGMMETDMLLNVEVVEGFEHHLKPFETIVRILSQSPSIPSKKVVWLASSATDGRTGLVVRGSNTFKILGQSIHQGLDYLFRRPGRPLEIRVSSVHSAFTLGDKEVER